MQGVKITNLQEFGNPSNLFVAEYKKNFDFASKRIFFIKGKKNENRGNHAHKLHKQFIICLSGSCLLKFDDGFSKKEILVTDSTIGIGIAPLIWGQQKYLENDSILAVLTDHKYDENDYIRNYIEFKKYIKNKI